MPKLQSHKGHEIEPVEDDEGAVGRSAPTLAAGIDGTVRGLKIDKQIIEVAEGADGKYSTSHLPYTSYRSVRDLAKAVIEHSPDFDTPRKKVKKKGKKKTRG